jgi:hypothetical protein
MRRLEIQLQQCLFYERDLTKSCEMGMHYQNNTNQTPKNTRQHAMIIRSDVIDLSWLSPRRLIGLLSLLKISSTDGTEIARASA